MGNPTTRVLDGITARVAAVLDPRGLGGMSEDDLLSLPPTPTTA
ncbi:hypothetical protein [Parafrigoribacterium mesophilum]